MEPKTEPADDLSNGVFESFDDVLSTSDTEYRTVKAWGGKMARVGSLTAGQMISFLENNDDVTKKRINGMMLIAQSLVDKTGKRLVNSTDKAALDAAIESLKGKDAGSNGRVVTAILELNGLNKKDAKEIAKNVSGEAPNGASPSDAQSS